MMLNILIPVLGFAVFLKFLINFFEEIGSRALGETRENSGYLIRSELGVLIGLAMIAVPILLSNGLS